MKVHIDDIINYSFCAYCYSQGKTRPKTSSTSSLNLKFEKLLLYTFRREFELQAKTSWKQISDKWVKIFWSDLEDKQENTRLFQKSLIGIKKFFDWYSDLLATPLALRFSLNGNLDNHQILSEVPFVLHRKDETVACIFTSPVFSKEAALRSYEIICTSLLMNNEVSVTQISNISFNSKNSLSTVTLFPDENLWNKARTNMSSILTSMQSKLYYTNGVNCTSCYIGKEQNEIL